MSGRPAAFLDRDGVLNVDHGYVYRAEDWEWNLGALEALRYLADRGYLAVVVTNQSGIARGFYTSADLERLHAFVAADAERHGAPIAAFYHCPHGPDDGCACRKPLPGMILQAARELGIDLERSFLIGDRETDLEAARAAGVRGALYTGGSLLELVKGLLPD